MKKKATAGANNPAWLPLLCIAVAAALWLMATHLPKGW